MQPREGLFFFFLKPCNFNNNNNKNYFFKKMKALWISFASCWISVSVRKCAHQNESLHFPALCLSIQRFTSSLKPGPPLRSMGFTHFWINTSQTWVRLWFHGPGWGPKGSLPTSSPITLCCWTTAFGVVVHVTVKRGFCGLMGHSVLNKVTRVS